MSLVADLVEPVKACAKVTGGAVADGIETALATVTAGGAKETGGAGRDSSACQSNMAAAGNRLLLSTIKEIVGQERGRKRRVP